MFMRRHACSPGLLKAARSFAEPSGLSPPATQIADYAPVGACPAHSGAVCRLPCSAHPARGLLRNAADSLTVTRLPASRPSRAARIAGLSTELAGAAIRDDLQDVGRRAREILIDCGQLLADTSLIPAGQPAPKAGDAKAWLDLFLVARASGSHRDALRRFIRAAWELAQTVTHGDIDRVEAFAAARATVLAVRTLQALAGADPDRPQQGAC